MAREDDILEVVPPKSASQASRASKRGRKKVTDNVKKETFIL